MESKAESCHCTFLHEAATDPKSPIVFDKELNEFHITTQCGYSMVYFCPICGGAAPKSLRGDFFAHIPEEEEKRFRELNEKFKSLDEFIAAFGPPDREKRTFYYKDISETADVAALTQNGAWLGFFPVAKQMAEKLRQKKDKD
jgi:hypothetical protein